jgi:TorA maturation chaperone TorD
MRENQPWEIFKRWLAAVHGLARGFSYPDGGWVGSLLSGEWPDAMAEAIEPWGLSADSLKRAVTDLPSESEAALEALQVEYTYLFINAVPRVPAPPYASAYAGRGLLMAEPAEAALQTYREAGLAMAEDYRDLPDHLAAELEFMAWLGLQAVSAYEKGEKHEGNQWEERGKAFLSRQILPWLPEFCHRVEDASRISFYREMARLAAVLLGEFPEALNPLRI